MVMSLAGQSWDFHNPVAIRFGEGAVCQGLRKLGACRALLVTTPGMVRRGTVEWLKGTCPEIDFFVSDRVTPNPDLAELDALAAQLRPVDRFDSIVALGGGSAVDTGKILSILLGAAPEFTLRSHFHEGAPIPADIAPIPVVAIPTTSGTGSEVTPFATVWDIQEGKKYSLASPAMFPRQALLEPLLTKDLPWEITLYTGLDALCQALESIWNRNANPITLELAYRAAGLAWGVLQQGEAMMQSISLRTKMMEASLLAGLAISHTRTALCHSISYPITAHYGVPHGFACGFVMPAVMRFNSSVDDGRLQHVASILDCRNLDSLISSLDDLLRKLGVFDVIRTTVGDVNLLSTHASEMLTKGRSDNNLRSAEVEDISALLKQIF